MKIKLTCSACGGEETYKPKIRGDNAAQDKAHASLHKADCAWAKCPERMAYMAHHGAPVESEVIESEVAG